jgi:hypothetical protein
VGTTADAGFTFSVPDGGASKPPPSMPPTCAASSAAAMAIPLDVFLLVDTSGSMAEEFSGQSKWQAERAALESFLGDPGSAGLGAGLQFFPLQRACTADADCGKGTGGRPLHCYQATKCLGPTMPVAGASDCDTQADCDPGNSCTPFGVCPSGGDVCAPVGQPCTVGMASATCTAIAGYCDDGLGNTDPAICLDTSYGKPVVDLGPLPMNAAPITKALHLTYPRGGTPMRFALLGAHRYLRDYQTAHPDHKVVLVLATDGQPEGCNNGNDVAGPAAMALAAKPPIPTYGIGVFQANDTLGPPTLAKVTAAGGTGMPFVLQPGANLTQAFIAALDQIRGAALPCAFAIPPMPSGQIDFAKVNFHLDGAGGAEDLPYVGSAAACGMTAGWYYDADPKNGGTPTQVILCPAACTKVKSDAKAKVSLTFGCQTKVIQ